MGGPIEHTEYLRLMRRQDWAHLMAMLLVHAFKEKRLDRDTAEQIAADTIARVCDPERSPWDPARNAALLTHLTWVFDSELALGRRTKKRRKTSPASDDMPEAPPDSEDDPDIRATRQGNLAVLREKLFTVLAKRPLALKLLALEEEELISDVDQQVARTGATRAQVYEARRVLADAVRAILAEGDHHLSRERAAVAGATKKETVDE